MPLIAANLFPFNAYNLAVTNKIIRLNTGKAINPNIVPRPAKDPKKNNIVIASLSNLVVLLVNLIELINAFHQWGTITITLNHFYQMTAQH